MRIISGDFGGRRLKPVPGRATRPTTDKVKESIFNIIGPYFSGGQCLDLFAGSGALGIEAVSRGMDHAVLIDRQYAAIQVIKENVATTKAPERFKIIKTNAERALSQLQTPFDLVLLDPPYAQQKVVANLQFMQQAGLLNPAAQIMCETSSETVLPDTLTGFTFKGRHLYGLTAVTIYQKAGL
ncbi:16S rRNA (guanine(966)-N(2))-methyltransferase RsmD [Loigolactobacillus bifermentans]|jgi:16S rRNA (guanine(966)-N(2))-methyltransferase RsmD|uniref:Putative N6-adenine-specific methylase (Putative) n=1 Tax=Loigolactobacillus bifermentans DSM 20003 TaxID=1423726 RepID=A0A0R1GM01_9LACO|nr:16S rRNA (guanine(966)-N(2))-methyltransferase RsmD [Loigolactobacillus bifermentans]KRK35142.1 putative N6-adenine-specific methylase (putative) [Loigolactobacillus bifermentans DSM 20003]QGG59228.1 16S rRNA (guanine(966)-N(2))-methyltransferase RsmD [Loigolactobacillus bifermentans]